MPYTPQTWIDNNASYPLSAARMNVMETGIQTAASVADQGQRCLTTVQKTNLGSGTVGTRVDETTLAQLQIYVGSTWMPVGGPMVFTNEAARDAAVPSPTEGMTAYLTAPTIPAATGTSTALPTGIQTIHNGSSTPTYAANWVCVTPIGSRSDTSASTASTSYVTTLTSDATAISVTLVTGTSALVQMESTSSVNAAGTNFLSFSVSGATTLAAADLNGGRDVSEAAGRVVGVSRALIITGLTAGTNTFTLNYRTDGGTTTYSTRNIIVSGIA